MSTTLKEDADLFLIDFNNLDRSKNRLKNNIQDEQTPRPDEKFLTNTDIPSHRERRDTYIELNKAPNSITKVDPWKEFSNHIINIKSTSVDFHSIPLARSYSLDFKTILNEMMKDVIKKRVCDEKIINNSHEIGGQDVKSPAAECTVKDSLLSVEVPVEEILADDVPRVSPKVAEQEPIKLSEVHAGDHYKNRSHTRNHTEKFVDENVDGVQNNRQYLYNRYIYDTNPDAWTVGLVNKPDFLIERARRSSRNVSKKRPQTCHLIPAGSTKDETTRNLVNGRLTHDRTNARSSRINPRRPLTCPVRNQRQDAFAAGDKPSRADLLADRRAKANNSTQCGDVADRHLPSVAVKPHQPRRSNSHRNCRPLRIPNTQEDSRESTVKLPESPSSMVRSKSAISWR